MYLFSYQVIFLSELKRLQGTHIIFYSHFSVKVTSQNLPATSKSIISLKSISKHSPESGNRQRIKKCPEK